MSKSKYGHEFGPGNPYPIKALRRSKAESRPRRSRRRRRGSETVRTKTRRRDAAAAINVEQGWERIASSMASLLGRPRIPPECTEFKDSYLHENGYRVGGEKGEVPERRDEDGELIEGARHVKCGTEVRTKQPYAVHLQQREASRIATNHSTDFQQKEARRQGVDEAVNARSARRNNRAAQKRGR